MPNFTLEDLKNFSKDDVLHAAGLQRTASFADTILPALAIFGAGLITGLGAGLLLAPNSGEESRKKIAEKAQGVADKGEEVANKASSKGEEMAQKAKHKGEELADRAGKQVRGA